MHQDQIRTTYSSAPAAPAPIETKRIAIIASLVEIYMVGAIKSPTAHVKITKRHYSWFHKFKKFRKIKHILPDLNFYFLI